jgi:hypothetical protein
MRWSLWLLCLFCFGAEAEIALPKELTDWQGWVMDGEGFRHCPFYANTDGSQRHQRLCAWPGRLLLEVDAKGGRFTQQWNTFNDSWLPLPGDLEHWPSEVTVNGAAVPVVALGSVPSIRVAEGTFNVQGQFGWDKRPESLAVPNEIGILSLSVEGRPVTQPERTDGSVWLGKAHEQDVARTLHVEVYRLLSDGIPMRLQTMVQLQVAGDAREESLPPLLPAGFTPIAFAADLPVRMEPDGQLRVQVRPGRWTLNLAARAVTLPQNLKVPTAVGVWPHQEIWSYEANERLRVAGMAGAESIDAAQASVPPAWRAFPSYRVATGADLKIEEHARGVSSQEANHLALHRDLFLDFSHQGYTAIDRIDGQMRSGWRLDMRAPYALQRASSGLVNLLVTNGDRAGSTGVELRSPTLEIVTQSRLNGATGAMPASGWNERFESVAGVLQLPPGHRLLAALGADEAPQAWISRWGLMDAFLVLLASVIAFRLYGRLCGAVLLLALILVHQEDSSLVLFVLPVLLAGALLRALPAGRGHRITEAARAVLLVLLLVVMAPFALEQLRYALYPQLADPAGPETENPYGLQALTVTAEKADVTRHLASPPPPKLEAPAAMAIEAAPPPNPASKRPASPPYERYAPGSLVQAGPGMPQWRAVRYDFSWSGPVDPSQTVRFLVASPWQVALWRVAGIGLLVFALLHLVRGSVDVHRLWRLLGANAALILPLTLFFGVLVPGSGHAETTPSADILASLKTRLTRPPACAPNCASVMSARIDIVSDELQVTLKSGALATVAVPLPALGERLAWRQLELDGQTVSGVWRDHSSQLWMPVKAGVHTVKLTASLGASDAVQILFPVVPHTVVSHAEGWDVSGASAQRLLANTLELVKHRSSSADRAAPSVTIAPFVSLRRDFLMDLDWSVQVTLTRIAPEKGGFTLPVPLLPGERLLSAGVDTQEGRVLASLDSTAGTFVWRSALPAGESFTLKAPVDKPWSEIWVFRVSPMWRAQFAGVPATLPEDLHQQDWSYEYHPRPGESLTVDVRRPSAVAGSTLAIDRMVIGYQLDGRSTVESVAFDYRSTIGGLQTLTLPHEARVRDVRVDGEAVPIRAEGEQLPLTLLPGTHKVDLELESNGGATLRSHLPAMGFGTPSSNVSTTVKVPLNRWVLLAGGPGSGPVILYWGELVIFLLLALGLGAWLPTPLTRRDWLLLGLGVSTFSWKVLLLVAAWAYAVRWRGGFDIQRLAAWRFKLLQAGLVVLSIAALIGLVLAIPYGLLGTPDMRVQGLDQSAYQLNWFVDLASAAPSPPWVVSLSLWWYKIAMLAWALWLAFALARWLPVAWQALGSGGFWPRQSGTR